MEAQQRGRPEVACADTGFVESLTNTPDPIWGSWCIGWCLGSICLSQSLIQTRSVLSRCFGSVGGCVLLGPLLLPSKQPTLPLFFQNKQQLYRAHRRLNLTLSKSLHSFFQQFRLSLQTLRIREPPNIPTLLRHSHSSSQRSLSEYFEGSSVSSTFQTLFFVFSNLIRVDQNFVASR